MQHRIVLVRIRWQVPDQRKNYGQWESAHRRTIHVQVQFFPGPLIQSRVYKAQYELFQYRLALEKKTDAQSTEDQPELRLTGCNSRRLTSSGCCRIMTLRKRILSPSARATSVSGSPSPSKRTLVLHMTFQSTSLHRARIAHARLARTQSWR